MLLKNALMRIKFLLFKYFLLPPMANVHKAESQGQMSTHQSSFPDWLIGKTQQQRWLSHRSCIVRPPAPSVQAQAPLCWEKG